MAKADKVLIPQGEAEKRHMQRAKGKGGIITKQRDGQTHIAELYQEGCAKIRLPKTHSNALEAVLINTAGGLTGGDKLEWEIKTAPNTHLVVTTQACERIYRSSGGDAEVTSNLSIGENAHVDWLPQETILFEQSRFNRLLNVDLKEGATFTGIEAFLLGREAMGEAARTAVLHDRWRIKRNGKLIHAEASRLSANDLERDSLSLLAGNNAFATIIHVSKNAEARLAAVRALIPSGATAAVSAIGERLIIRILAPSGLALRRLITPIINEISGVGAVPRLWST